jgi:hypothetical protein
VAEQAHMPQTVLVVVQQVGLVVLVRLKLVGLVRQVKVMQEVMLWGPLMDILQAAEVVLGLLVQAQQRKEVVLVVLD